MSDDLTKCEAAGVDLVFTPDVNDMYPADEAPVTVNVPTLARVLEGQYRPNHFEGVCTVVAKLLGIFTPDEAAFGQKDYQQLCVIRAMVAGLSLRTEIVPVVTLREADGLAMSSRNRYLGDEQRERAVALYKALRHAVLMITDSGETDPDAVESAMRDILTAHDLRVDYAALSPCQHAPTTRLHRSGVSRRADRADRGATR